jgi:sugar O-acyltransferase (sialic acid O-acetyltransferase NeuD family)
MKKKLIIVGTGVNARHVYCFIKDYDLFDVLGFAVDKEYKTSDEYLGLPVYEINELRQKFDMENTLLFIAIFWNRLNADRRSVYERLKADGYKFANVISPNAIIHGAIVGDNCWIHDNVIINSDAVVKSDVMIMANAFIGQDSLIENHCFCGARCLVAAAHIGEQTFLGLSSTVFDGVKIGKKCLVGACCAVKRNMPAYSLCKTPNDSVVFKQYDEDTIESKLLFKKNIR